MHKLQTNSKVAATVIAYSEWRPDRYRVKDSRARNYGLFTSREKAERFAGGILMSLDEGEHAIVSTEQDTNFYVWVGDDIGLGDAPATVLLRNDFGNQSLWSVRTVLRTASMVDAYGLNRIVSALRLFAGTGELHPHDLAAWREFEDEYPTLEVPGEML